ncbi:MAG: hypothetical protein LQ350_008693 [Teloschistes chrysophthalmus]|nr:MAG: hypothetical protein LQ350_008693 [Niorma chrysophthalma]
MFRRLLSSSSFCLAILYLHCVFAGRTSSSQSRLGYNNDDSTLNNPPLFSLHRKLVEIPSISGNEHDVGEFLASYLEAHQFTVEKQRVAPFGRESSSQKPRHNLLAYPSGSPPNASRVLLTSHLDVVPPYIPYTYNSSSHQIAGRGVIDDKACVAAQVTAAISLLYSNAISPSSLALLFVVGEEIGGDGMRAFSASPHPAYSSVIFGEPTELKLVAGHKGNIAFTVSAKGKSAHSGYPWLGKNANSMLIPALLALDNLQLPFSDKYGDSTLNIGKMVGGEASNVIPASAHADIQVRVAAEKPEVSQRLIVNAVKEVDEDLEVDFWSKGYGPVEIDHDVAGFETQTVNFGTDIPWLDGDHKRYLYGPGSILDAHSDHEHVSVEDLEEAVEGYKRLVLAAIKN